MIVRDNTLHSAEGAPDDAPPERGAGGLVITAVVAAWAIGFGCFGFDSGVAWALALGVAVIGTWARFARMES